VAFLFDLAFYCHYDGLQTAPLLVAAQNMSVISIVCAGCRDGKSVSSKVIVLY